MDCADLKRRKGFCYTFIQDAAAAKSLQSCSTPCDPIDGSPPGSPVSGQQMPIDGIQEFEQLSEVK